MKPDGKHLTDLLVAYLDGELAPERETEVEAHLRACAACSDLHAAMKRSDRELSRALEATRNDHAPVERLDAYRLGQLTGEEPQAISAHLRLCVPCREALSHLSDLDLQVEPSPQARRVQWLTGTGLPRLVAVAAILLVLLAVGFWYFRSPDQGQKLAALAVIEPAPYLETRIRGGAADPAVRERLRSGMQAYNAGRYREAIAELAPLVEQNADFPQALFFLGVSYLLAGEPHLAIGVLDRLLQNPGPYAERAHWYLANAYLLVGDGAKAEVELERIVPMGGERAQAARTILEKVRRIRQRS